MLQVLGSSTSASSPHFACLEAKVAMHICTCIQCQFLLFQLVYTATSTACVYKDEDQQYTIECQGNLIIQLAGSLVYTNQEFDFTS